MQEIKIKYLNDSIARVNVIDKGDWIDLTAAEDYSIRTGELQLIHLGVAMKLPDGYEAHIAPRSSTFKKWGVIQANSVGVVDNSYCGPNDWWMFPAVALRDTSIAKGDRICQFRIVKKQEPVQFTVVSELEDEDRGGFGSTGSK